MITEEKVLKNLNDLKDKEIDCLYDEIVCAFESFNIDGESEVIVSINEYNNVVHCHINHKDAQQYWAKLKRVKDGYVIASEFYTY